VAFVGGALLPRATCQRPLFAQTPQRTADGLRRLEGQHLLLLTDLPSAPAIDELPHVFDLAVGQWAEYFAIPPERLSGWKLRGYLMRDPDKFRAAGWLPDSLPPFPHGYQRGDQLWVHEQPSDYYRRHLLLHEGTHAFMSRWLKGLGPPWYMEGTAELLATHRWHDGRLTLNVLPADKEQVPEWGRIKLIRDAVAAKRAKSLDEVFAMAPRQFSEVEAYAWSWAVATLLDGHPAWHQRFRALGRRANLPADQFHRQLIRDLQPDRPQLEEAWQIFLDQLDYGYSVAADAVLERPDATSVAPIRIQLDTRRGWQSTGLRLAAGQTYSISATGRYRLKQREPAWYSEAGGVTIQYHRGLPMGMLLAAIRPDEGPGRAMALTHPRPIGLAADLTADPPGVLFLRINEGAGALADNEGTLWVEAKPTGTTTTTTGPPPD
jgi:hypothetical protein